MVRKVTVRTNNITKAIIGIVSNVAMRRPNLESLMLASSLAARNSTKVIVAISKINL